MTTTADKMFEEWVEQYPIQIAGDDYEMCKDAWKAALAASAQQVEGEAVAWKHDCAALLTNDVELWIDRCPHCGKPSHPTPPTSAAVPEGYKLLKDSTHAERAWIEDAGHENGLYSNTCIECGREFAGHKRRVICRVCAAAPTQPAPTEGEQG